MIKNGEGANIVHSTDFLTAELIKWFPVSTESFGGFFLRLNVYWEGNL